MSGHLITSANADRCEYLACIFDTARDTAHAAIAEIHERRLYKAKGYSTFEAYCVDRFGISRTQAYRLVAYDKALKALPAPKVSPMGDIPLVQTKLPTEREIRAGREPAERVRSFSKAAQLGRSPAPKAKASGLTSSLRGHLAGIVEWLDGEPDEVSVLDTEEQAAYREMTARLLGALRS